MNQIAQQAQQKRRSNELREMARAAIKDAARSLRFDADETVFLTRQLEHIEAKLYDIKYPTLKARDLVPKIGGVPSGAEVYTYREYDARGVAKIIADYGDDLPRADVVAQETTISIKGIGSSYGYSIQEMRAAQMAGIPLDSSKAASARRQIEEQIDKCLSFGSVAHGMKGLLNQSGTGVYVVPNGGLGSPLWSTKTADEILKDLNGIVNSVPGVTNGVEYVDTLCLPIEQHALIASTARSANSDTTILEYFMKNNPWIKEVIPWYRCKTAGASGVTRAVAFRRDSEALGALVPQEFEQLPVQPDNLTFKVPCHARCGGVVLRLPLTVVYADNI